MANFYKDNQDLKFQLSNPLMERIVELKENNYADYGKYDYAPKDLKDAIDSYVCNLKLFIDNLTELLQFLVRITVLLCHNGNIG